MIRITPEIHDLSHCRGNTSRHTTLTLIYGALVVIRLRLAPVTSEHGSDNNRFVIIQCGTYFHLFIRIGQQVLHLFLVLVEPPFQVAGKVGHVKRSLAVAQNLLCSVVTCDNDKRGIVARVKHIVIGAVRVHSRYLGMGKTQRDVSTS